MTNFELLAPAGDFECLLSAIKFGADAIYLGATSFGMRAVAANFNFDLLEESVKLAQSQGVKIYLTCNTIPLNDEVAKLKEFLQNAQEIGVDGLIVADLGVFFEAKKVAPKLNLHVSTQFGVVNHKTANALFELGAKRVVLARELSLADIKTIRQQTPKELELECFVHGAMCVSFSGRCLISQYMLGRDANRGQCAQPCRWSYGLVERTRPGEVFEIVETDRGSHILNSKDLCLIKRLKELKAAGISSLKIEGRAKSAYYVGVVTNAYRTVIENGLEVAPWVLEEVEKVSHRPYCEGFLFEKPNATATQNQHYKTGGYVRAYDVVARVEELVDGLLSCTQKNKFYLGDELELVLPKKPPTIIKVEKLFDEKFNLIESAPHAQMKLFIKTNLDRAHYSNLELEGCFLRKSVKKAEL